MKVLAVWLMAGLIVPSSFVGLAAGGETKRPTYGDPQRRDDRDRSKREDCVKACELDLNPCDPWLSKKADGRCSG